MTTCYSLIGASEAGNWPESCPGDDDAPGEGGVIATFGALSPSLLGIV